MFWLSATEGKKTKNKKSKSMSQQVATCRNPAHTMISKQPFQSLLLHIILTTSQVYGDAFDDLWSQYMQQTDSAKQYESTRARRERNLDHWDVPTAAAYLGLHPDTLKPLPRYRSESSASDDSEPSGAEFVDEYIGHDAAILFYAQWCQNCHAVAPSWDAIATHLNAGSRSSKLVMALFDCEKSTRHMELCLETGVSAYPTMMFIGSGAFHDTDVFTRTILGRDKSAGPFGATTLRRTVKFQGNWRYGDQILDWVNVMRGLSAWHSLNQSGPLKILRNGIFGLFGRTRANKRGSKSLSLPVGVPSGFQTDLRIGTGSISGTNAITNSEVTHLEAKLNATNKERDLYEQALTHSSHLLDGMLFPAEYGITEGVAGDQRDVFKTLTNTSGWFENATYSSLQLSRDEHPVILRSCATELSIDYCSRVTSRETNAYITELSLIPDEDPFPTLDEIEKHLADKVSIQEPYCALVEMCALTNYETAECRPMDCPFVNKAACRYLQNCFSEGVQNEYGVALGLIVKGESVLTTDLESPRALRDNTTNDIGMETVSKVGGWGINLGK